MSVRKEDCDFYLWTSKTPPIKNVIELLRNFLSEGRLRCSTDGIRLTEVDTKKIAVIQMYLKGDVFEEYYCNCKKDKYIDIGLNIEELFKHSKSIDNTDTLKLFIKKGKSNKFGIETYCKEENNRFTVYLNTIDINDNKYKLPDTTYKNTITMSSTRFHKICKNFDGSTSKIEIRCSGSEVIFKVPGNAGDEMENCIKPHKSDKDSNIVSKSKDVHQGVFKSRYLLLFAKCSDLNNLIEINISNDKPIILKSNVASLGYVRLCLAQCDEEDEEN